MEKVYFEDLADEVVERFSNVEEKVNSHMESVNRWINQMGIRVKTQIEGMKTEVDKGMKRIDLFLKRIQEEREIEERTLKRDAIDINKMYEKIIESRKKEREYFDSNCIKDLQNIKKIIGQMIKSIEIQQALERQDEIDRKGVMFLGMVDDNINKSRQIITNKNNYSITVDNECISCSKQQTSILKAFKIACISYKPSLVEYSRSTHSREELISVREELLKEEIMQVAKQLQIEIYSSIRTIQLAPESKVAKGSIKVSMSRVPRKIKSPTVVKRVVFSNESQRNQSKFSPFNSFM